MQYLTLNNNNGISAFVVEQTPQGNIRKNVEFSSLSALLEQLNKNPRFVKGLKIEGKDLIFTTNGLMVKLQDYKMFKENKDFSFIFRMLNNKRYKLIKNLVIKGTAVGVSSVILLGVASNFISNATSVDNIVDKDTVIEETQKYDLTVNKINDELISDNTVNDKKEISQTKIYKNPLEENIIEPSRQEETTKIYQELNVGKRCNNEKAIRTQELYYSKIQKYAKKYGLNPDIVCAIATQERGIHSSVKDSGGAIGLMQIQVSVWHDKTIDVFDYEENKIKTIYITQEKLEDIDFNIEVGCAVFQDCLNHMNGNVIAALQSYNTGPYAVDDIIRKYSNASGKSKLQILEENDLNWLDYRTRDYNGDPEYVEHVLSYFKGDVNALQVNIGKKY